jgi:hypothetical protein
MQPLHCIFVAPGTQAPSQEPQQVKGHTECPPRPQNVLDILTHPNKEAAAQPGVSNLRHDIHHLQPQYAVTVIDGPEPDILTL